MRPAAKSIKREGDSINETHSESVRGDDGALRGALVLKGQDSDMTDEDSGVLAPTSAKLQVWANKLGYTTGQQMQVRMSTDPKGDTTEHTGVDFNPDRQPNAFGFHGVEAGTVIDHIQAHEGEDDGIEFFGGTANCRYCVSSGSKDDSLDWAFGWTGTGPYIFIQQDPNADNGIEADNNKEGPKNTPRSHPNLYNVTMVGGLEQDDQMTSNDGMRLRLGTAITARNVILTGFGGDEFAGPLYRRHLQHHELDHP